MSADRDPLDELIGSVSDGTRVDWDATLRAMPRNIRSGAQNLRDVARIASFHRELQHPRVVRPSDGEHWGPLLLLERLGSGASADVYRAWDPQLRREVALKLLRHDERHPVDAASSPLVEEGRAAARIRHPNVVTVHGIDVHQGRVGLWMELILGRTLDVVLERQGPLPPEQILDLARELGAAVSAVHAAGLLHRDLKPANVVRDLDGRWVLADFGLGTRWDDLPAPASWSTGTPMYMAPELLGGAPPTVRSDIYALGMVLRFAAVGRHAFETDTLQELRSAAARGPRERLASLRADLPADSVHAIERAIAPDPAMRFATASAFLDAVAASRPGKMDRRGGWARWVPAAAALVAVATLVMWTMRGKTPPATGSATYDVTASFLLREPERSVELASGDRVEPGDHLSLRVRTSRESWVYVLNEDDRGERYLLYPQSFYDVHNPVEPDSSYVLPGRSGDDESVWTVTSAGGHEHFLVVVSPEPVGELEAELASFSAPIADAPIEYTPVTAATIERLRGVGGLSTLEESKTATASPVFDHFRALAGRETGVRGVWVRHLVLLNSG